MQNLPTYDDVLTAAKRLEGHAHRTPVQSFRKGERVKIAVPKTIADGAQTQRLGALTFGVIQRDVTDILIATDD